MQLNVININADWLRWLLLHIEKVDLNTSLFCLLASTVFGNVNDFQSYGEKDGKLVVAD